MPPNFPCYVLMITYTLLYNWSFSDWVGWIYTFYDIVASVNSHNRILAWILCLDLGYSFWLPRICFMLFGWSWLCSYRWDGWTVECLIGELYSSRVPPSKEHFSPCSSLLDLLDKYPGVDHQLVLQYSRSHSFFSPFSIPEDRCPPINCSGYL